MSKYKTTAGINPSMSIGAAVSLGVKDARGIPIEKDRFHIVMPHEADNIRLQHPAFAAFNNAKPEHRRMLRGNLVSVNQEDCFEYYDRAQTAGRKGPMHPNKLPFCQSDGVTATRWMGDDEFKEMPCLGDKCQYVTSMPPSCTKYMRLMFILRWNETGAVKLPRMVVKFTSKSRSTVSSCVGLFKFASDTMKNLGMEPNLFGLPFTMTLVERTNKEKRSRYPTVQFAMDMDIIEFATTRSEAMSQLSVQTPLALPQAIEAEYEDYKSINVDLPK